MNLEIRLEPHASPLPSPYPSAKVHIKLVHADGSTADELLTQSVMMNLESCLRLTDIDVWIRKHEPAARPSLSSEGTEPFSQAVRRETVLEARRVLRISPKP